MSKYIKKVNWPWVEILTKTGTDNTALINVNELTTIWNFYNGRYNSGIRYKNGDWCEVLFSDEALDELKELIMNNPADELKKESKNILPLTNDMIDMLHESQTMFDWLNEEGQA